MVGGFAYGELYEVLRGDEMPLIDRPYVIVQLMILEAPEAVPPEAALVAFWYAMPVAFVLLVALGAADFVNLVFNRDEQRNPWAEALALTYRNHVIVFGAGHVGERVIRDLVDMGLDVVAIDQSPIEGVEYSTIRLPVAETSFLVGRTVGDLQTDQELDIVLVERTGEVSVQPSRDPTVQAGDDLVFFARHDRVLDVVSRNVAGAAG